MSKWIAWHGLTSEPPIIGSAKVLLRNGNEHQTENAEDFRWEHINKLSDVVSYQSLEDFKEVPKHSHYHKDVSHLKTIDVYRVMELWEVTSPSIQHAIKKLLVPGGRGAGKDMAKDIQEAIDSLVRWQEMQVENSLAKDQQQC